MGDKGKKDKGGRETKKKDKLTIKEKRKQKRERKAPQVQHQLLYELGDFHVFIPLITLSNCATYKTAFELKSGFIVFNEDIRISFKFIQ